MDKEVEELKEEINSMKEDASNKDNYIETLCEKIKEGDGRYQTLDNDYVKNLEKEENMNLFIDNLENK